MCLLKGYASYLLQATIYQLAWTISLNHSFQSVESKQSSPETNNCHLSYTFFINKALIRKYGHCIERTDAIADEIYAGLMEMVNEDQRSD